jgi:hypothetical protein
VTARIESAAGATRAAPKPWSPRVAIRSPIDWEIPARNDAAVKMVSPVRRMRRLPSRSASRPPNRRNPPSMRPYAMTTHCSVLWLTPRSRWIEGKATFTMATSRTTMNCAAQVSARMTFLAPVRAVVAMSPPHSGVCQDDERAIAESTP